MQVAVYAHCLSLPHYVAVQVVDFGAAVRSHVLHHGRVIVGRVAQDLVDEAQRFVDRQIHMFSFVLVATPSHLDQFFRQPTNEVVFAVQRVIPSQEIEKVPVGAIVSGGQRIDDAIGGELEPKLTVQFDGRRYRLTTEAGAVPPFGQFRPIFDASFTGRTRVDDPEQR